MPEPIQNSSQKKRPLVFLAVGGVNTLLDFLFYTFLTSNVFNEPGQIALAGLVSGTFALVCAFLTHSLITWRGTHVNHKTILKFVLFTGFGMWVLRPLLLAGFVHLNGLYHWVYGILTNLGLPFSEEFVTNTGAFGLMIVIVLIYNFFVYDKFVFSHHTEARNE